LADLPRQSVYSRLAGYEDPNDAERLSPDPTFRLIGSEKIWDRGATLTSPLQSFETVMLHQGENSAGLARLNQALIGKVEGTDSGYRTILDMDSTEVPVYGEQEQSAYNGYLESTCFHPRCCSMRRVIVWGPSCSLATCIVPKAGKSSCCRRSSGNSKGGGRSPSEVMQPLPGPKSTGRWRKGE
jgi:hypothetical protein